MGPRIRSVRLRHGGPTRYTRREHGAVRLQTPGRGAVFAEPAWALQNRLDMLNTMTATFPFLLALSVLGLLGCEKRDTTPPRDDGGAANLCSDYSDCNGCIDGQMAKGHSEGEAQTQCGLAVTGCWTTWDKPVVCGGTAYEKPASSGGTESKGTNLCTAYSTCDGCIQGQIAKGKTEGEAETLCGLAVTGCWVTWDKPVVCGETSYDERP